MIEALNEEACIKRSHEIAVPHLIVSITDPTAPLPEFSELSHPVIRFCFMDLDFEGGVTQRPSGLLIAQARPGGYRGPSDVDVENIAKAICVWDKEMPFLIHCAYGQSRSVAVALAAGLHWGVPVQFDRENARPNRRLSKMLDAELGLGGRLVEEAMKYDGF